MMTSVTVSVLTSVIEKLLSGGNSIDKGQVSLFQLMLGLASLIILLIMKWMSRKISSPTVKAEILGWKLDVAYSLGMSLAFFIAVQLQNTSLGFLSPYFDQIIAIVVMIFMVPETIKMLVSAFRELFLFSPVQLQNTSLGFLSPYFDQIIAIVVMIFMVPETIKMLVSAFRELFLFSPEQKTVDRIKEISGKILENYSFTPVFYDISRTGRKMWVSIYFQVEMDSICVTYIQEANKSLNEKISQEFPDASCEIILDTH